jgi:hypothetical protein
MGGERDIFEEARKLRPFQKEFGSEFDPPVREFIEEDFGRILDRDLDPEIMR